LQRRLDTATGDVIFEGRLDPARHPYLADHVIHGHVVLPAAFYLETVAAGVREATGCESVTLEEVAILSPVRIPETGKDIQLILSPKTAEFQFFSREEDGWRPAVRGNYSNEAAPAEDSQIIAEEVVCVEDFYAACGRIGLRFGPAFRGLRGLRRRDGAAIGEIESARLAGFALHPAALDACLQTLAAALPGFDPAHLETEIYMPVGIGRFELRTPAGSRLTSRMRFDDAQTGETQTAHGSVVDATGAVVARISGLRLKRAPKSALARKDTAALDECFYEVRWEAAAPARVQIDPEDELLIVAAPGAVGERLRDEMTERGIGSRLVLPGEWAGIEMHRRIVYLADHKPVSDLERCCRPLLDLLHAPGLDASRLWIVTTGSQAVVENDGLEGFGQSALWGMGRVIALEHPELHCVRVDLDAVDGMEGLLAELAQPGDEPQVAYRQGRRYVPRLTRIAAGADSVCLEIVDRGTASGVAVRPCRRQAPGAGEVEIEVRAAGLNFRDVLNVMGLRDDEGPLGGEGAGIVTAVGEGVTDLRAGDEVVAITRGGLGSHAIALPGLALKKPRAVDFATAAASPFAFLTARYALEVIGRMKRGERVLIHAAAGGVGMAAVELARRAGLEIFATAGSPAKREYLQSLGIERVYDSRSLAFADEIRLATDGEGVDLVLNSLTGGAIEASLGLLRAGGRFLEIGKAEIWTAARVAAINPDASYDAVDLAGEILRRPETVRPMFEELMAQLADGRLRPLPLKTFPLAGAGEAIEYMARARHIGKVVLLPPVTGGSTTLQLKAGATYMITGGLTGLGLAAAGRLVERGARSLALLGRRVPSPEASAALDAMRAQGACVTIVQADVSSEPEMRALFAGPLAALPPLRGVIHCAGHIEDGVLAGQDWDRFARVLAPKADGAWLLHRMTEELPLDFFVLYSSASALFGGVGQASYASANAFLDGLAHYRRARGLPAQSIDWGAWGEIGVAARNRVGERLGRQGIGEFAPAEGLDALERVLRGGWPQVAVIRADWTRLSAAYDHPAERKFFAHLGAPAAAAAVGAGQLLADAAPEKRRGLLLEHVRAQVAAVIGMPAGQSVAERQPLRDLGLDSLMAVELCNRLRRDLGIEQPLAATIVFDHPTVAAVADYLASDIYGWSEGANPAAGETNVIDQIEQMTDEEVDRMLSLRTARMLR
jgi:NADPH:quinone reductase-like Zn-dependent oxidoreductase/acyl carrier protein